MALSPIKKQNIQRDEINSIFSGMNNREIAKKSILSRDWLFQRLRDPKIRLSKMSRPELGRMYLYCYDAKWKDVLPYWDQYPVTIVVDVYPDGFAGMNFHYLPIDDRLALLNILTEQRKLEKVNPRYAVKVTYPKLATLR